MARSAEAARSVTAAIADAGLAPAPAQASTIAAPDLPLLVVARAPIASAPSIRPRLKRRVALPVVTAVAALGTALAVAIAALYFQPPPVRWAMAALGLDPGGGASAPIAVPGRIAASGTAAVPARDGIVALGVLKPRGEVTVLATPYGSSDARIAAVDAAEGDEVAAGQVLARLDNAADLSAAVAAGAATVALRAAELDRARRDTALSRDEAQAALDKARVALRNADAAFARADRLARRGAIGTATRDDAQAARDQAEREVAQLSATLARYAATDIEAQPDVRVAARALAAAETDLAAARQDLEKGRVRAPFAGTILKVHVRAGERPGDAGLFEMADLTRMKAEVEVYQSDVARVRAGAPVTITSEAFGETLTGTVDRVGLSVDRQQVIDGSPAANTDARVILVHVGLDAAASAIAARYTNLQVVARIGG